MFTVYNFLTDQGYDPFSPEVVRLKEHYNGEAPSGPDVDLGTMELELVNRAIEAVRNEMERDKKKLSRIGDQEYEPTTSTVKRQRPTAASTHQGYDPGSYQMGQATEYNPTPRSSKYTLDSENSGSNASALEYVPTVVSKTSVKKKLPVQSPYVLQAPAASSKRKYTLDNSKPSTDMEYDPLLNYCAKPALKEQRTLCSDGKTRKRFYPTENQEDNEEYVPMAKKPKSSSIPKYTASFSESDEESSGTEYRPTSLSRLQLKGINTGLKPEKASGDSARGQQSKQVSKTEESFSQSESDEEVERTNSKTVEKKKSLLKSNKPDKLKKDERESVKKTASQKEKRESASRDKTLKSLSKESVKIKKIQSKHVEGSSKSKDRSSEKIRKEGVVAKSSNEKSKKTVKGDQTHRDKDKGSSDAKKAKIDKPAKTDKEASKFKDQKNGRHECISRDKDKKKSSSSSSNKEKSKKSSSDQKGAKETKQRSLSHADLFGAESADEDDDDDERIVRKSASAFKLGSFMNNTRKTSEVASSSEDDFDDDNGVNEDYDAVDYSCLQAEMEYDSDPMEECLRIFNESKEVKTEDKGRQAKQVQQPRIDRLIYIKNDKQPPYCAQVVQNVLLNESACCGYYAKLALV